MTMQLSTALAICMFPAFKPAKRPALQLPCEECRGHGEICHGHPMDPDARITTCEVCSEGEVDATCQICGGDDPAVEAIRGPGDDRAWLACEACVDSNGALDEDERAKIDDFDKRLAFEVLGIKVNYLLASITESERGQAVRS